MMYEGLGNCGCSGYFITGKKCNFYEISRSKMLLHKEPHLKYIFQSHQFHINTCNFDGRKQSQPSNEISLKNFSNFLLLSVKKLTFFDFPQKTVFTKTNLQNEVHFTTVICNSFDFLLYSR